MQNPWKTRSLFPTGGFCLAAHSDWTNPVVTAPNWRNMLHLMNNSIISGLWFMKEFVIATTSVSSKTQTWNYFSVSHEINKTNVSQRFFKSQKMTKPTRENVLQFTELRILSRFQESHRCKIMEIKKRKSLNFLMNNVSKIAAPYILVSHFFKH